MADAAIPTDVEDEVTDEQQTERPKTAREIALEQLELSRRAAFQEETGIDLAGDAADDADVDEEEVTPDTPAPKKVKLKVDGEEREVDEQAVIDAGIRALQKESAADRRLEEATRLLREAQLQVAKQTAPVEPPKEEQKADDGDVEKEVIDALMTGDEEKAKQALRKFREAARPVIKDEGRTAIPDPAKIAAEVKAQLSFESASVRFKGDFPEIVADPYLAGIADQYLEAALKSGDHKSWDSALTAAGKATRDWLAKFKGESQPVTPPTTQRTGLAEKKRGIDSIPSASSSATSAADAEPESVTSVIAAMKKARGQVL